MDLPRIGLKPWAKYKKSQLQKRANRETLASPENLDRPLANDRRTDSRNANAGEYKVGGVAAEPPNRDL